MKKEFVTTKSGKEVEKELLEIEIKESEIDFFMWKQLKNGQAIYNRTSIDKQEFMDFMEEAL